MGWGIPTHASDMGIESAANEQINERIIDVGGGEDSHRVRSTVD